MRTNEKAPGRKRRSAAKTKRAQPIRTAAPGKRLTVAKSTAAAHCTLIETAAYFRAEQRGFAPGHELEDWLAAEAEVQKLVRAGRVPVIQGRQ